MKNLYRSYDHKVVGGVAGGISEYFNIDPIITRVLFVVTTLSGGAGILIYLILWVIVPSKPFIYEEQYQEDYYRQKKYASPDGEEFFEGENHYQSEYAKEEFQKKEDDRQSSMKLFLGVTLFSIGLFMLIDKIVPNFNFDYIVPAGLVFLGTYLLLKSFKRS